MDKNEIIKEVVKIIKSYLADDYKIYLFGSWVKGNAAPGSDLDIGILGNKEVPFEIMVKIRHLIEGIPTLRNIDLVDFNAVGKNFRENVLRQSRLIDEKEIKKSKLII